MKRVITVTRSQREFLAKAFGVTKEMVSYALNFHPVKGQSDLAKKIRSLAVQRGGFELVTAPTSEVVHDADNMMRQHFENGWMWEGDKNTGVLELQGGRIKMRSPPKVLTGNFRPSQLSFFLS